MIGNIAETASPSDRVEAAQDRGRAALSNPLLSVVPERVNGIRLVHVTTVPETLNFLLGQVGAMKAQGVEVEAVSSPGAILDDFAKAARIAVHPVAMQRRITPGRDLVSLHRLWRLLRHRRPQIVHSHTPKGGLLGMIAAWLARVPVRVYTLHGLPLVTASGMKRRLLRWSEKTSCFLAHEVLCVSHSLREVVEQERICPAAKLHVLGGGSTGGVDAQGRFDPDRFDAVERRAIRSRLAFPDEALVIGFVGRIVRDKGVVELIEAWNALREERPESRLLIIGPFEDQDPIPSEVIQAMRSDARIHLTGPVTDTTSLYAAMDVLALPTYREGLSQTLLEAAAMGLPTVASRVAGCVDPVQDGVTGTLVPARDPRALADALRTYLDQPELRRKHGKAGRDRVLREFLPELLWDANYRLYTRLLQERGGLASQKTSNFGSELGTLTEPKVSWAFAVVKRFLDIVVALVGLIAFAPLMALVALTVRWRMGGPVLFRQVRPGRYGRLFEVVKFRTMRDERDADGRLLADAERTTRLGRFLRKASLDELPQLWNVLKGEMSLVGPRPLLPEYLAHYSARQNQRHLVRPGITGLAQVSGRNLLPWEERLELDVRYVENASLGLDLRILVRTAWKAIRGSDVCLEMKRFDELKS